MRWQEWRKAGTRPIHDISKVVAVFEVDLDLPPKGPPNGKLKVKILETTDGRYFAVPDFLVQTIEMGSPYGGSHPQDSVDEAFSDALRGLFVWGGDVLWILNPSY
jgi:hypothetical protein